MPSLAVFRQVGGTRSSAVCAFSLTDIERVFKGKYKELNKETSRWTTYRGSEVNPRPGSVSTTHSSQSLPEYMGKHSHGMVATHLAQPLTCHRCPITLYIQNSCQSHPFPSAE